MKDDQRPAVFQFKSLRWYFTFMPIVMIPGEVLFLIGAIQDESMVGWFAFFLGFFLFFVLGSYLAIRAASDIVVDSEHISRQFAGRIVQSLSWGNIQEVTVVRAPNKEHPNRVGINFIPKVIPRRSFTKTGRIAFATDPMLTGTVSELLNAINDQIIKHGIKVAWWMDGIKTYTDYVEWPLPPPRTRRQTW